MQQQWFSDSLEGNERAAFIKEYVENTEKKQDWIKENMETCLKTYLNNQVAGFGPSLKLTTSLRKYFKSKAADGSVINAVASVVDTLCNRTTSRAIKPMIIPDGLWANKRKAKKLEKFILGVFQANKFHRLAREIALDGLVQNIGYLNVYEFNDKIHLERIPPHEMTVDEQQARLGKVRDAVRTKYVPLYVAIQLWPEHADSLKLEQVVTQVDGETTISEMIEVREAWHLGDGANPGFHCISTNTLVLFEEEYEDTDFPFAVFRAKPRSNHFIGLGVVEEVFGLQSELNDTISRIRDNHTFHANPPIFVDIRSKVEDSDLTNAVGRVIKYDSAAGARPPQLAVQATVHPEMYDWGDRIKAAIYEQTGVSQLSAQGLRPAGNELSGVAFRVLDDLQTMRFANLEMAWQNLAVDAGQAIIRVARKAFADKPYKVKYVADNFIETIDWKDSMLEDSSFQLAFYPASLFPETPSGKIQTAQELLEAGLATPQELKAEIFHPEMTRLQDSETAALDDIRNQIDNMLYEGVYVGPTKYQDLKLGIKLVNSAFLRGQTEGAPEENLMLLMDWMDEAKTLMRRMAIEAAQEQQEMAQMLGQQGPEGQPGAPQGPQKPQGPPQPEQPEQEQIPLSPEQQ